MVTIQDVRTELQLPTSSISDSDIQYVIDKIEVDDIYLICADVLRLVKRKYNGRVRLTIGRYEEWIDLKDIQRDIDKFMAKSTTATSYVSDGFEYPEARFQEGEI